jgi:hypothetical protein
MRPYGYSDTLPPGTDLHTSADTGSAGIIGTPTKEGTFQIEVDVTSSDGCRGRIVMTVDVAPRLSEQETRTAEKPSYAVILDADERPSGSRTRTGGSRSVSLQGETTTTPVPNDLRYRSRPIGGQFGRYVAVFKDKRVTKVTLTLTRGRQYCFSAEPHAAAGKGWGTPSCVKVKR